MPPKKKGRSKKNIMQRTRKRKRAALNKRRTMRAIPNIKPNIKYKKTPIDVLIQRSIRLHKENENIMNSIKRRERRKFLLDYYKMLDSQ